MVKSIWDRTLSHLNDIAKNNVIKKIEMLMELEMSESRRKKKELLI